MKKLAYPMGFMILLFVLAGCAGEARYHKTALPEPASFNAHFGDMDTDGSEGVDWSEFQSYFPQATPDIFKTLDLNADSQVDHEEWHAFKESHGMRDHD